MATDAKSEFTVDGGPGIQLDRSFGWSKAAYEFSLAAGPDVPPSMTGPERCTAGAKQEVVPVACRTCGIVWWMSDRVLDSKLAGESPLFCPNGHERKVSEESKLAHYDLLRADAQRDSHTKDRLRAELADARTKLADLASYKADAAELVRLLTELRDTKKKARR